MGAVRAAVAAFREGCAAVSPFFCVKESLSVMGNSLRIKAEGTSSKNIPLEISSRVTVIAFGKASVAMTAAAEEVLGDRFRAGAVLAPHGIPQDFPLKSRIFHGAKVNLPDEDSVSGTMELLKEIERGDLPENVILFLISGGGSALFCAPEGVTLEEKLETIRILVNHGATIQQLNTVRQSLSSVKGGRTLERVKHAQVISLIISDVIGDPVSLIASGPTVPPPSSVSSALSVLSALSCSPSLFPSAVVSRLSISSLPPPSKPSFHAIIASNPIALSSVSSSLSSIGFHPFILSSSLSGDASQRGIQFAHLLSSPRSSLNNRLKDLVPQQMIPTDSSRLALIFGGETTVEGAGKGGLGGRCQHMVLSCLKELLDKPRPLNSFVFLSAGTDGQDGPTKAAGAVISEEDVYQADLETVSKHLEEMDSFNFWSNFRVGACHVITGKTGTNVMDIQILLIDYGK